MKTIYKYRLEITDEQTIDTVGLSNVLSVGLDPASDLCLWCEVDTKGDPYPLKIHIVGTGNKMSSESLSCRFIGSVTQGPFVWHVFGAE